MGFPKSFWHLKYHLYWCLDEVWLLNSISSRMRKAGIWHSGEERKMSETEVAVKHTNTYTKIPVRTWDSRDIYRVLHLCVTETKSFSFREANSAQSVKATDEAITYLVSRSDVRGPDSSLTTSSNCYVRSYPTWQSFPVISHWCWLR